MLKLNMMADSRTGKRHIETLMENQDRVLMYEDDTIAVLATADGCSACECAAEAAELTVNGAVEFAKLDSIWHIKLKNMKQILLDTLDRMYLASDSPYDDLCATLAMVVIHKPTHKYIAITIGDCSAFAIDRDLRSTMLLSPMNLLAKNQTVFANSYTAKNAMKIKTGRMEHARGFVLYTDGANALADEPEILRHLAMKTIQMEEDSKEILNSYMEHLLQQTHDDVTVGIMMIRGAESTAQQTTAPKVIEEEKPMEEEYENPEIEEETEEDTDEETEEEEMEDDDTLRGFLRQPRTPEEVLEAGYCTGENFLLMLAPYLQAGVVTVENGRLMWN
ncbi:MAG: protein phosphatase 2C domain-containing protein [Oscillospiraceae bacterium]|nr:protein phosphatase 2C domain-containing protein [Oscillospiraceae bacterium]